MTYLVSLISEAEIRARYTFLDVNFCRDHRDKIEVPDPLAVEDLISSKLNNKRKLARLITQYREIFFPIFRKARPSFFRLLQIYVIKMKLSTKTPLTI